VIIHARVREEFYSGKPHTEALETSGKYIDVPTCYNGDIFRREDANYIYDKYPELDSIMLGRGILRNPVLPEMIKNSSDTVSDSKECVELNKGDRRILDFMEELFDVYKDIFKSDINTLYHMKELWSHLCMNCPDKTKEIKTIRKTKNVSEYKSAVKAILG